MRELGELESRVMQRLWTSGGACTVRDVLQDLSQDRPLAYTTVMTVLDNLHKKGFVSREAVGRAYHYRSVRTRDEHAAELISTVLDRSQDRPAALLKFVERLDPHELVELQQSLARLTADLGQRQTRD